MTDQEFRDYKTDIALIKKDIKYVKKSVEHIEDCLEKDYVTRTEFQPVQRLIYGLVSLVMCSFVLALIYLVVKVH